jgi:hypothetical protein
MVSKISVNLKRALMFEAKKTLMLAKFFNEDLFSNE